MATLTRNNCRIDPKSGGVIFHGSPELQKLEQIQQEVHTLHAKLDELIEFIKGGIQIGRKMENPRLSTNDDQKVQ